MTLKERYSPKIPFVPYLKQPLQSNDFISEGFIYTRSERSIHKQFFHKGIDYACEYGTPVFASADGYAVAGYHRFTLRDNHGFLLLHKDKPIANGFGYFVQIFHPENICGVEGGRVTQYGHLSKFAPTIKLKKLPFFHKDLIASVMKHAKHRKIGNQEDFERKVHNMQELIKRFPWVERFYGFNFKDDIESYLYTLTELRDLVSNKSPWVTYVHQGDLIGFVGTSAIFYGEPPYDEESNAPDIKPYKNVWDEVHLHFEEATRDAKTRMKILQRDPYDIYKSAKWYKKDFIRRSLFL